MNRSGLLSNRIIRMPQTPPKNSRRKQRSPRTKIESRSFPVSSRKRSPRTRKEIEFKPRSRRKRSIKHKPSKHKKASGNRSRMPSSSSLTTTVSAISNAVKTRRIESPAKKTTETSNQKSSSRPKHKIVAIYNGIGNQGAVSYVRRTEQF